MFSLSEFSRPSDAQLARESIFLEEVKADIRPALISELGDLYDGFGGYSIARRVACIELENRAHWRKGDSLVVEFGSARIHAYSGNDLGTAHDVLFEDGTVVTTYKPLFENVTSNDIRNFYTEDTRTILNSVRHSVIRQYIYHEFDVAEPLAWNDLPRYEELPIAYRVALVCQYVHENVVATPSEVTAFVLGAIDGIDSHRCLAKPRVGSDGLNIGWSVTLGDLKPKAEFGKALASHLRNIVYDSEAESERYAKEDGRTYRSQFDSSMPAPRSTNSKTETAYTYLLALEKQGKRFGRGGDYSYDELAAMLVAKFGDAVRCYTPKNLRDGYSGWKRRHGYDGRKGQ